MATGRTELAHREYWLQRRDSLRCAANLVSDLLGVDRPDTAAAEASRLLAPAAADRLKQVTGDEPILRWAAWAGAVAIVLRRFGAGGATLLLTGAPLQAGLPVLLRVPPLGTFREWLTTVLAATTEACDHGAVDGTILRDYLGGDPPLAIGPGEPGGIDATVVLELLPAGIRVAGAAVPVELLRGLVDGAVLALEQGLADPDRRLDGIGVLDDTARREALTKPLPVELARRWHGRILGAELPPVAGAVPRPDGPETSVYILDEDLQPVPAGVTGQLYIGGPGVWPGRLVALATTAAAFLPDPFTGEPGARMFRTGDRGRWRTDGSLQVVGDAATRVLLRGRSVELGEVEAVLNHEPGVGQAAAVVVDDLTGERLVAFVAGKPDGELDAEALATSVSERLPTHLVPDELRILDALPAADGDAVDRAALRALAAEAQPADAGCDPPRNEVERALSELWSQYLGLDQVGIREDFFALGGDSIIGIRIVQEMRRRGYALRPRHVLEFRTIEELARVADQHEDAARAPIPAPAAVDVAPLAPAQQAFFARALARHDHWNNSLRYPVRMPLPVDRLEHAVTQLAQRHPALRTRFVPTPQGPLAQRAGDRPPRVTEVDLRNVPVDRAMHRMHEAATELHASLDLRQGPIGWFAVFRMPGRLPDQLVVILHHAVVDLYSWDIVTDELSALLRDGGPAALPAPTTSFPEWSRRLADEVRQHPERFDASYWLDLDWSVCQPVVPSAELGTQSGSREVSTVLRPEETGPLVAEGRGGAFTLYERLLAALGVALGTWLGDARGAVSVLLGGHGRQDLFADLDLSRTVGWFTATYPFLLALPDGPADRGHAERVAQDLRRVPRRGFDYPALRYLADDGVLRGRLAAVPPPQVAFDFARAPAFLAAADGAPLGPAGLDATGLDRPAGAPRDHAIEIFTTLAGESLRITCRCTGSLISAQRLAALERSYVAAVVSLVDRP